MKKISFVILVLSGLTANAQKVNGRLHFETGQQVKVSMQLKTTISQQAMGQAVDFNMDAIGDHSFMVTNSNDENSTLSHQVDRIRFNFDGMGQKRGFDSNVEKDLKGQMGEPVKELLGKKYNMIIDSTGNTLMTLPEKIQLGDNDPRMAMISNMMKDIFNLVQPPAKGRASFFKVLPAEQVGPGDAWTESMADSTGRMETAYSITAITDTTIQISFSSTSNTVTNAEMMGSTMTTSLTHQSKGTIVVDRKTGIIREKNTETNSTGTTEGPFGSMPLSSKTTTTIKVE